MYVCIYMYVYIYMYVCIYIYIYIYTHTHSVFFLKNNYMPIILNKNKYMLISLSIVLSRSIHLVTNARISFIS